MHFNEHFVYKKKEGDIKEITHFYFISPPFFPFDFHPHYMPKFSCLLWFSLLFEVNKLQHSRIQSSAGTGWKILAGKAGPTQCTAAVLLQGKLDLALNNCHTGLYERK